MNRSAFAVALVLLPLFAAAQGQEGRPHAPANVGGEKEAVIHTDRGDIVIALLKDVAPRHVAHFVKTASAKGYDGTTFHRIIRGGIIQGGDPLSKDPKKAALYGTGGLGLLKAEFSDIPFQRGVVAAARRPGRNVSGGSQFFIVLTAQPSLAGQYTVFGRVVSGIEVADKIGETPVVGDKPTSRVEMTVTIRDAEMVRP
jgi:cyclophilin family peptidyl-prolyl cis-trans isomerase